MGMAARALVVFFAFVGVSTVTVAEAQPPLGASGGPSYSYTTPAMAFDGNAATFWQGDYPANGAWTLAWGYTSPQVVTTFSPGYYSSDFTPASSERQCSVDGATWSTWFSGATCRWVRLLMGPTPTSYTPAVTDITLVATPTTSGTTGGGTCVIPSIVASKDFLALGDSITAGAYSDIPWPYFGSVWGASPSNWGVNGDTSAEMLARLSAMLTDWRPVVIVHCCTNDAQVGMPIEDTVANITQIVSAIRAAGKTAVLVGPLPRNNVAASVLLAQSSALEAHAATACYRFINLWRVFESVTEAGKMDPRKTSDGTHPNAWGSWVFMRAVACALGWWCGE